MRNVYFTLITFIFCFATATAQNIVINEVLASNTTVNTDENGDHEDWIELYNAGASGVNLNGYGLTDDGTNPYMWTFPNVTVGPGQYLLIWCSDKNRIVAGSPLHTNFKISASGETLVLTKPDGIIAATVTIPELSSDISYGRVPNGSGSFLFLDNVTPGAVNSASGYSQILPPPVFSHNAGFYTNTFQLTISTNVSGASIIYTVDGSEPDAAHIGGSTYTYKNQYPETPGQPVGPLLTQSIATLQYNTPINIVDRSTLPNKVASMSTTYDFVPAYIPGSPIYKGTVIRAKVVKPGALTSKTESRSYFISPQGTDRFSIPVISFAIDEDRLFDFNDGIFTAGVDFETWRAEHPSTVPDYIENIANFYRRGIENEVPASMEYFVDGTRVVNQDVGIRVNGGSSRAWQNKSLAIYARDEYGTGSMDYEFFPGQPANYDRIALHNSGSDFFETLFRDALCQQLMKNINVVVKGYQPTVVFLNGEYWGILSLRDKIDNNFFKRMYNIPDNEIDVIASQNSIEEGDGIHYTAMMDYLGTHFLTDQANYSYITTQLDPENFADYFISNIFLQNVDWPSNNILRWRKKTSEYIPNAPFGHDGRWRWYAHDMDATFAIHGPDINHNSLAAATATNGPSWPNPAWSTLLLRKMLENDSFEQYFITRFADLLNTTFLPSRITSTIDEMKAAIEPEIPEQSARWDAPSSVDYWNFNLNLEKDFGNQRPDIQRTHIRQKFNIASNINATINVSDAAHGYVKVNTINIKDGTDGISGNPYPWTGIYFSNIPVTLKAVAAEGFAFSHWSGASSSTEDEITISTASSFSVTAHFVPDNSPQSEPIYFWMMDGNIENDIPLTTLASTFTETASNGILSYQSCLSGYPFTSDHPNWRKASMERRNSPTTLNYIPEANNNLPFATSDMKGIQIKEPLHTGSLQNTLVFSFTTSGYEDIKFSFAAMNELTNATGIAVDYAVNSGTPTWITTGIASSHPMAVGYELHEIDFTSVASADNNPDFKVRLRFTGTSMATDNGNRVTFNNIAAYGTPVSLGSGDHTKNIFSIYPNPVEDFATVTGITFPTVYKIFTIDGKLVREGILDDSPQISMSGFSKGIYLLRLESGGKTETKKIIKD
ncbi:MAG TPA: CotH kinase family protein [Flavobacterium sp.]|jgi:hypothetical protein